MERLGVALVGLIVVAAAVSLFSDSAISWDEARNHEGEERKVCGEVASARVDEGDAPLFLNLGLDYPDPDRFTFVVAEGVDPSLDLDLFAGLTVCGEGTIIDFQGSPQIHLPTLREVSAPEFEEPDVPMVGYR